MGNTTAPYLWQHGNDVWYICWNEPAPDGGWRTRRISCRTTDRIAADAAFARFEAGRLTPVAPERPTVSVILDAYVADLTARGKRSQAASWATLPLKERLGKLLPEHITEEVTRAYIAWRRTSGKTEKPISDSTIRRELAGTLRPALVMAERKGWIARAPHIESTPESAPRARWLTRAEFDRLAEECRTAPHLRLFTLLALNTAARTGAILSLTWDRVDFDRGLIDYGGGHGNKRRAVAPINDDLLPELLEAHEARTCDRVIEFRSQPVESVKAAFKRAAARAGIPWAHPHLLRHTAATWMVEAGVPLEEVARMLGDTKEVVERVYGKHSPDYLRSAAKALQRKQNPGSISGRKVIR